VMGMIELREVCFAYPMRQVQVRLGIGIHA